jgi:hypothetical protein
MPCLWVHAGTRVAASAAVVATTSRLAGLSTLIGGSGLVSNAGGSRRSRRSRPRRESPGVRRLRSRTRRATQDPGRGLGVLGWDAVIERSIGASCLHIETGPAHANRQGRDLGRLPPRHAPSPAPVVCARDRPVARFLMLRPADPGLESLIEAREISFGHGVRRCEITRRRVRARPRGGPRGSFVRQRQNSLDRDVPRL